MQWIVNLFAGGAAKAIFGVFGDSILKPILDNVAQARNVDLEKFKAKAGVDRDVAINMLSAAVATAKVSGDIIMAGMNHPIWWVAWIGFIIPVLGYNAAIYFVSIFDAKLNAVGCSIPEIGEALKASAHACSYYVRRVPPTQEAWANTIMMSLFGAQVATGLTTAVINRWSK